MDLPRFRGGLRAWDQGIWSDGRLTRDRQQDDAIEYSR
jgi:hypothetical protein